MSQESVLVVDDEDLVRDVIAESVRSFGYICLTAEDGLEGLDMIRRNSFLIIITDIRMPGFSGLKLMEKARRIRPHIPFILMTGYAAEMKEIIREGSLAHRKAFIRGFVKDIRVTGEKAVLSYSPPGLPDKVELNLEGVPRIVQHGGQYWT